MSALRLSATIPNCVALCSGSRYAVTSILRNGFVRSRRYVSRRRHRSLLSFGACSDLWPAGAAERHKISVNRGENMGGLDSTRWAFVSTKDTVESARSLGINSLNRAGSLHPGYRGVSEWTRDGNRVASINLRRDDHGLILSYRVRRNGGEWRDVERPTQIVWMPCRLGGWRPYFLCPGIVNGVVCNRWVTKLYGAGDYFLCRHCYRLAYASQRENGSDRAFRRGHKIRARLGGDASMAWSSPRASKGYAPQDFQPPPV